MYSKLLKIRIPHSKTALTRYYLCLFIQRKSAEGLDNNQDERDDEKPTIVVLNEGDLTEEEVGKLQDKANTGKEKGYY